MNGMTIGLIAACIGMIAKAVFVVLAGYSDKLAPWLRDYGAGPLEAGPAPWPPGDP